MSRRSHGPRRGLLAGVIAALVVAIATLPAAAQQEQEEEAPITGSEPVSLELVRASAWVAANGEVALAIATGGDAGAALARIEIHERVDSVDELDAALDGDAGRRLFASRALPLSFIPELADGTRELRIRVSPTDSGDFTARLPEAGVHPATVSLLRADGTVIARERTPIVRLGTPDDPLPAPRLAVLVDVDVRPSVGPDGTRTLTASDLARLDRVRTFLDGLAAAGDAAPPVSLAVVPDALDALTASTDPRAARILATLSSLDDRHLALGLPYVTVSTQALLDADLARFLPDVVSLGRGLLDDRLGATITTDDWPAVAPLDARGAAALIDLGVRRLIVPGVFDAPEPASRLPGLVPAGPRPLTDLEPLEAITTDPGTTRHLLRGGDPAVALAELVLRTPAVGDPVTTVVRVDDIPDDAVLRELAVLLTATDSPVPIGGLELVDAAAAPDAAPLALDLPTDAGRLDEVATLVRTVDAAVTTFADTVAGESARAVDLRLRVTTALAASLTTDDRRALLDSAAADVADTFAAITLEGQTDLNLTSRSGTLPLELHNETGFPVRVVVSVRSDRLLFPQGDRFEVVLEEEITRFDVPVEARATGSVPTFVTMTTPDGSVRLDMRQLNVRSTAVTGVGLALSIGALAVLVLWWGRSWWRGRAAGE